MGFRLLGKGQNSLVFKCRINNNYYACKVRRFDSPRPNLLNEGYYLRLANSVGVGPRLFGYTDNVLVIELINGIPIQKYITTAGPAEIRAILTDLLWQCRRLDSIGLAHNELSRPQDHIIISSNKAFIIDFESASLNSRVSNVAQLLNALIMGKGFIQHHVKLAIGTSINLEELRNTIKRYKSTRNDTDFMQILRILNLLNNHK
ncbi:serine/threonine protein kinase [Vulcanisaeta distributa]|uniref:serine/threonine protein kinase n=1 Tax=Vulcanisaeta distributa TaxID=164451 RepID=UPI000A4C0627|nr:serine/threonine protein kinase [Vulcanisaeta distributa]